VNLFVRCVCVPILVGAAIWVLHDPLFAALGPMGTLVVAVAFGLTAGAVGAVVLGGDR